MPPPHTQNFHKRASQNFLAALHRLQHAASKSAFVPLDQLEFEFSISTAFKVETGAQQLENATDSLIAALNKGSKMPPQGYVQMVKDIVKRWFQSSYPFALMFLTIAKEGASVSIPRNVFNCRFPPLIRTEFYVLDYSY